MSTFEGFEGFEPVFGSAQGKLEPPATRDLLPFLFCLRAKDSDHLVIHVTDFHANTWYADMSTEFLEDLVGTHLLILIFSLIIPHSFVSL